MAASPVDRSESSELVLSDPAPHAASPAAKRSTKRVDMRKCGPRYDNVQRQMFQVISMCYSRMVPSPLPFARIAVASAALAAALVAGLARPRDAYA